MPHQVITLGRPALPQLAKVACSLREAVAVVTAAGPDFLAESKLDGERMQLHVVPGERRVAYFSRAGVEHGAWSAYSVLDKAVLHQVQGATCSFTSVRAMDLYLRDETCSWVVPLAGNGRFDIDF